MNHFESILNDHQRKVAEGGKNDEGRNKEMPISRRLEGLRSSRLDHSMQNFIAALFRRVLRPDSPDLAGQIKKYEGVIAEGGQKQRNGHISTPRRPQKLSIGPFDAEFHGGGLGTTPEA